MHQHPRPPPAAASPAGSPQTDPSRTNNSRNSAPPSPRVGSERSLSIDIAREMLGDADPSQQQQQPPRTPNRPNDADSFFKLNQVIQSFYTKAALIILSQRAHLTPALSKETSEKRVNKWFNVEVDETNDLLEPLRVWKGIQVQDGPPPPMVIEVFIDAAPVNSHSLILQDDAGHQWGVEDAIRSHIDTNCHGENMPAAPRIILERWRCQMGRRAHELPPDLNAVLPKTYKNSIVLFRSLYAYLKLLPAWDATKKSRKLKPSQKLPKVHYRIYEDGKGSDTEPSVFDELEIALDDGRSPVTDNYAFDPIDSPAGPYTIEVTFRRSCDFRLEKSMESLYSSRFIGQDEEMFKPSLDRFSDRANFKRHDSDTSHPDVGSLPQRRPNLAEISEQSQAYGSLSTYHGTGIKMGSSPISALRAARDMNLPSSSGASPPLKPPPENRLSQGSRPARPGEGGTAMGRRPSVSFMPFKTPSLAASPLQAEMHPGAAARIPVGRTSALSALAEARRPSGAPLTPLARATPVPGAQDPQHPASLSSSPRPQSSRYSSSFGHRRSRLSIGGSKTEDDNSSGKVSLSSSTQKGSGPAEGGNNSSGSLPTDDDDNISDFLKMLDQRKELKSFDTTADGASQDAGSRRSNAVLSKYQRLKDTNAALTDSLTTSLQLNRSPSSSSRQLSSVPPMVAGTSASVSSSSPAERVSPRTPHTPAIPSRLSANSIINYNANDAAEAPDGARDGQGRRVRQRDSDPASPPRGTGAIDIPTSPRFNPSYRRSSSVAQQQRLYAEELGDSMPYAMRSASMGDGDERQPVAMNELLSLQDPQVAGAAQLAAQRQQSRLRGDDTPMSRQRSADSQKSQDDDSAVSPRGVAFRPRITRGAGRGAGSPHGSSASLAGDRGAGSGSSDARGSRYSFNRPGHFEDEDMLFTMSDFNSAQGRRSLEDTPRASAAAEMGASAESNSQRGGRRGGRWS